MSLGTWFRDYVYFPLGGSRVDTRRRHIFNLFVVWLCTGVWHGANWTFITWGLMYFVLLVFEKYTGIDKPCKTLPAEILRHIYTMLFVIIGWVIFRANSLTDAMQYLSVMFRPSTGFSDLAVFCLREYGVYFFFGALFSLPVVPALAKKIRNRKSPVYWVLIPVLLALFAVSVSFIVKGSYNPFIYFNF